MSLRSFAGALARMIAADVRKRWHRLYSVWAAIGGAAFWSAVGFAVVVWPTLAEHLPLWFYIGAGGLLSIAFGVARFLKQPGAE